MKRGGRPGHEKRGGQWRRCGQEMPPKLRREGEGAGGLVEGARSDGGAVGSRPPPWAPGLRRGPVEGGAGPIGGPWDRMQ